MLVACMLVGYMNIGRMHAYRSHALLGLDQIGHIGRSHVAYCGGSGFVWQLACSGVLGHICCRCFALTRLRLCTRPHAGIDVAPALVLALHPHLYGYCTYACIDDCIDIASALELMFALAFALSAVQAIVSCHTGIAFAFTTLLLMFAIAFAHGLQLRLQWWRSQSCSSWSCSCG